MFKMISAPHQSNSAHLLSRVEGIPIVLIWIALASGCSSHSNPVSPAVARDRNEQTSAVLTRVPGFEFAGQDRFLDPLFQKLDPAQDEWDSEVFAQQANANLQQIAHLMEDPKSLLLAAAAPFFTKDFSTSGLRPADLETVFSDEAITVSRGTIRTPRRVVTPVAALAELTAAFKDARDLHVKFKIVGIRLDAAACETTVDVQTSGSNGQETLQQNAVWKIAWNHDRAQPRISSIDVSEFEEISCKSTGADVFVDQTASLFNGDASFRDQLTRGVDFWRGRLEANYGVDPNGNQGIALGDVNGDGLDDLFVCQQGGLPNRLYLRHKDGTLHDIAAAAGVDWMEVCRSALFVDLDNDGDQDLAMSQGWYLMIMSNDGTGKFTVALEKRSEANLYSTTAADYDNDGDLDLFFCGRNPAREQGTPEGILGMPIPYHDANNGGPNILLRNDGGFKFRDVTTSTGLDTNNRRYSYAASWEDYDNDGDMDLYVANDFGRNNLYRNDLENGQPRFHDVAAEMQVEDISAGMSVTWGDYNRDGWMDVYISNMYSSAGNRIAYQRQFRSGAEKTLPHFQRHARGNTLFSNARSCFNDVSLSAAVTMGRWAWGSKFVDLNNDGWEDIYVVNGFITTQDTGDL